MQLFNILTSVQIPVYGQTFDVSLGVIGQLIRWLINGIGIVGVGIIVFSLLLKLIVLPFDVYQRINMRKQNIKMKENQARMEKLQKQYANDKETYQRKVMEMYRESGLSVMSSCLPMILSMVIFIVAIGGFNAYSQYSNVENYNIMANAYNAKIEQMIKPLETQGIATYDEENNQYKIVLESATEKDAALKEAVQSAGTQEEKLSAAQTYYKEAAQTAVLEAYNTQVKDKTTFLWIKNIWATDASYKHPILDYTTFKNEISREEFKVGDNEEASLTDAINATKNSPYDENAYNIITGKLTEQKTQANGYYIMIVLSIGTIILQQIVSMRSQKEQNKYSSVDGQGASQQKTMLFVMTAMFGIFSFMYSAAFSIYLVMSNITSLLSTVIINKFVDKAWAKKEEEALKAKYSNRTKRISEQKKK
jgi:YidC/Oxa1 family membrane protein insertase